MQADHHTLSFISFAAGPRGTVETGTVLGVGHRQAGLCKSCGWLIWVISGQARPGRMAPLCPRLRCRASCVLAALCARSLILSCNSCNFSETCRRKENESLNMVTAALRSQA